MANATDRSMTLLPRRIVNGPHAGAVFDVADYATRLWVPTAKRTARYVLADDGCFYFDGFAWGCCDGT